MKLEALDFSELKPKRTLNEAYKSIPDNVYTKKFTPLIPGILETLRFLDWENANILLEEDLSEAAGHVFAERIEGGIALDKALKEGKIKRKAETMVYWGFPPNLTIRADLHSSSSVMIYGPSHDISFIGLNDVTREIIFIFNIHMEDGFPVDWWWTYRDEEIFKRRHMKLGYTIKEMPQKFPDIALAAARIREILIDIRNERTPQWANSSYSVALVFILVGITLGMSNWDSIGQIWDGVNAKSAHGLPHSLFLYEPWPPVLNTFFGLKRTDWMLAASRMLSGNQLYLQPTSKEFLAQAKKNFPDQFENILLLSSLGLKKYGIPLPSQSLRAIPPKFNQSTGEWESLEFKYPDGPRILYEDLDLSFDEVMSGVLFNITHKSKVEKVTRDHIISIGHGLHTKYLKPEGWMEDEKRKKRAKKKIKKIKKKIKFLKPTEVSETKYI